jgi:hypothetical protein
MILKNDPSRLNFIVDTLCSIGFENKGASFAVHMLAYEIASRGHNVYVFNDPFYPHENIIVIPTTKIGREDNWCANFRWIPFSYNTENTVSIYTQITWGNPFGTKYNCRWLLHDCDRSQWDTYGDEDLIYNYGTFLTSEKVDQEKLTVFDYKLDLYKNQNLDRHGFCYIIHKFTPEWGYQFLKNFDGTDLTDLMFNGDFHKLAEEFNKFEFLITFDYKSYITTAATLCGCKVIILKPDQNKTPLEYRLENPIQMCGVAYGWDDLEWADKTLTLSRSNIKSLKKNDTKTVDNFISYWEGRLRND